MRPLAALLIGLLAQADAGLEVAHLPHREAGDTFLRTEAHHCARHLAQDLALLPGALGAHLGLTREQPLGAARTHLAAAQALLRHTVDRVAPLFTGAQLPPRDQER